MRLFLLELKRLLKTRRSLVLLVFMLGFSVFMAYMPTTTFMSRTGHDTFIYGMESLDYNKEIQQGISGTVTTGDVHDALTTYQAVFNRYDAETPFDLPDEAFDEINAVQPLLTGLGDLYPDQNGQPVAWNDIDPARVTDYYSAAPARIAQLLDVQYDGDPVPRDYFLSLYEKVETPFTYVPGLDAISLEYMVLLAMVLIFCSVLLSAPVFASDLQTGADDIQRCTRHGRMRLGVLRVLASFLICVVLSAACLALYWLISNSLFGWEMRNASVQLLALLGPTVPLALNVGELQMLLAVLAVLTILATVSATLLLSSRVKNLVFATGGALVLCLLPLLVYMIAPPEIRGWLLSLLPSSGVCMQTSTLYAFREFDFLRIGDLVCWLPIAMTAFAALELVLFAVLTVVSHSCRKA